MTTVGWSVRSFACSIAREDELAGRTAAPLAGKQYRGQVGHCPMPYGRTVRSRRHADGVFYVEIPKVRRFGARAWSLPPC